MFGLLKFLFCLGLVGALWFSYDFYTHQSPSQSQHIKEDFKAFLDSGEIGPIFITLKTQMREDFTTRFWPKLKRAFDHLRDEPESSEGR